jgi:hypothetical protein
MYVCIYVYSTLLNKLLFFYFLCFRLQEKLDDRRKQRIVDEEEVNKISYDTSMWISHDFLYEN